MTPADAGSYRAIFALQKDARWAEADALLRDVQDPTLLGHVLAQRYLHRAYRARFDELQSWMEHYGDLPEAQEIRPLAVKRREPGAGAIAHATQTPVTLRGIVDDPADLRPSCRAASPDTEAGRARIEIRSLSRTDPGLAEQVLQSADDKHLLGDAEYDEARADVAEGYLFLGDSRRALLLAATARTTAYRPLAHWDAGLAAWRLGRLGEARSHFETVARTPNLSRWTLSAAAFWAARIHSREHRPDLAKYWLGLAAEHPRTFYGLLAQRSLGIETGFDFESGFFSNIDLDMLSGIPAARRAMALLQIGDEQRAELELRSLANAAPFTLYPALVALAERGNMPALSLQLASMLSDVDGTRHDQALYPMPHWEPAGGFSLDRALLFALVRQESQFQPDAQSGAGALGLMQLMPTTAETMADRIGIAMKGSVKASLNDPATNLALGQAFVQQLLANDQINGNLILLAAGYNSGPGNITRWQARPEYRDDPLLFLESLPSRETRVFVERVLTNYWVYRMRLGQPTHDLESLAHGDWPVYAALDTAPEQVARHVASR